MRNNTPSAPDIGTFQHLLQSLSLDPNLTDAVIDWIDADSNTSAYGAEDIDYLQLKIPYRAANQPMQSVDELRLVRGFTRDIVEKLRPLITVLPQPTEINVNTAKKEVLSALFYTLSASDIEQLMSKVPYKDQASLTTKASGAGGRKTTTAGLLWRQKQLFRGYRGYPVWPLPADHPVSDCSSRRKRRNSGALAQPAPADKHHRPHYYFHRKLHSNVGRKDIMMRDALLG